MKSAAPSSSRPALYELVFGFKRAALSAIHAVRGSTRGSRKLQRSSIAEYPIVLAESRTKLYTADDPVEQKLELGKVQNLRLVCQALNGAVLERGSEFSFWREVGKCTRGKGYVIGRELKEGCLVPAIGGGICQISNALYGVALDSGATVLERHGHSSAVPGSVAESGRDATVAWNYVDLRFSSDREVLIEAHLTTTELVMRLRSKERVARSMTGVQVAKRKPEVLRVVANSCATCGQTDCFSHGRLDRKPFSSSVAFLLDDCRPELAAYVREHATDLDLMLVPLDGRRFGKSQYAWPVSEPARFMRRALRPSRDLLQRAGWHRKARPGSKRY